MDAKLVSKLTKIYYSPQGYWKGISTICWVERIKALSPLPSR